MADQRHKLASTSKRLTHREPRTRQSIDGDRNNSELARQIANSLVQGPRDRNIAEQKQKLASASKRHPNREHHPGQSSVGHQIMAYPTHPPVSKIVRNIVLVGRTGNGKSATANSLLGKEVFKSRVSATGVTTGCQTYERMTPIGSRIKVIDTPGFDLDIYTGLFDVRSASTGSISKDIMNCLKHAEGGLHVVVLVLSLKNRFTQEEVNTLSTLQALFGNEILNYLVVLFTGGDVLAQNQTLGDYLRQGCPEILTRVLTMCDNRRIAFNNVTSNEGKKERQLQRFFALVAEIEERTHGQPYIGLIQRNIKKESERLRQEQKAIEARNLREREFAQKTQQLQMWYANKMTKLENEVNMRLKEISKLKEDLEKAERENINMRKQASNEQKKKMISSMINLGITASPVLGATAPAVMGSCSIL